MPKKLDNETKRPYQFHNLDSPNLIQKFSHATIEGTWERTLVPGAIVELTDWEYNFIVNERARGIFKANQEVDDPNNDPQRVIAKVPRFQLQPVIR